MSDYISREAAIKKFEDAEYLYDPEPGAKRYTVEDAKEILNDVPAAAVRPVKEGEWEWSNVDGRCVLACSKCGSIMPTDHALDYIDAEDNRFCYWCGARMGGTP